MCGIAGIYALSSVDKETVKQMTNSIQHRGPDAEGLWVSDNKRVGLGHRRLSIIDTSEIGNQPFHYLERYTIVFNGEIYNYIELREQLIHKGYKFRSQTDTEVLLALYDLKKEECLTDLDGMFSFCIWDNTEQTLFCARDRFGEKPFYYHYHSNKQFVFASEMKALFSIGITKSINNNLLFNYLSNAWLENPFNKSETFYNGIQKLEASHYLIINRNLELKKVRYWKLNTEQTYTGSLSDATECFKTMLTSSVQKRLRSDVAVGSSLSGGLDSSTIVAIVNSMSPFSQKTFSASFPGYEKDETRYMNMVIQQTNVSPFFTTPSADTLINELDKLFYHQEEPFASASILAQWEVMKLAKKNETVVLLDGQGADELLAGYTLYYHSYFQELYATNRQLFNDEYSAYKEWGGNHFVFDQKFKLQARLPYLFNLYTKWKSKPLPNTDMYQDFYEHYKSATPPPFLVKPSLNNHLENILCISGFENLLRYADRNSMAFSREVRLPYLDHRLVEFCYSLPSNYKIKQGWSKYVLRKAFEKVIPEEITWRKDKIGFAPPEEQWMQTPQMKDLLESCVSKLSDEKIINKDKRDPKKMWRYLMASKLIANG